MNQHPISGRLPRLARGFAGLVAVGVLAASCGGDDSASTETTESEQTATTATTAPPDSGAEPADDREAAIEGFEEDVREGIGLGAAASESVTYESYVTVMDDSGLLSVDVPADWGDVDGSEGLFGPDVVASVSVQQFLETFDVPGVEFQATTLSTQTPEEVLGELASGFVTLCEAGPVEPYADPLYTGVSQLYRGCSGTDTGFAWVAVEPDDQGFIAVVGVQIVTERDIEALGVVLDTFIVDA